jgi:hypothetical protein
LAVYDTGDEAGSASVLDAEVDSEKKIISHLSGTDADSGKKIGTLS